jgi:hypothetical protein
MSLAKIVFVEAIVAKMRFGDISDSFIAGHSKKILFDM